MQYFKVCSTTCTQRVFEVQLIYFQNSNVLRIFYYFLLLFFTRPGGTNYIKKKTVFHLRNKERKYILSVNTVLIRWIEMRANGLESQ